MTDMTDARVKPLEWADSGRGFVFADRYRLIFNGFGWFISESDAATGAVKPYKTHEAAKAAAQADYAARILSALEPPAAPVPVREWKCGRAKAVVMQDDDCFLLIVSDTPEDAAYLTREQFSSLLLAGNNLLAAMQADDKVTPETCAHIERDMRGVCFRCADDKGGEG